MKGPFERLKYDLRRVWECPLCHRRERTSGEVVNLSCSCQPTNENSSAVVMKLVEDGMRQVLNPPGHLEPPTPQLDAC